MKCGETDIHPLPLTQKSNDKLYTQLLSFLELSESGSVYYHNKSDFFFRINQLQTDKRLRAKYLKNNKIVLIDTEALNLEDPESWNKKISEIPVKQKALVFITGINDFLKRSDIWFFHYLMKKEIESSNLIFVLVFNLDFLHPRYRSIFATASTWIRRTIRLPLHSPDDTTTYLTHQSSIWNIKIDQKLIRTIADETTGGYFLLPKEALRFLRDNPDTSVREIIHHKEMDLRINFIWRQLLSTEQTVMRKILTNIPITDAEEKHSLEFLTETGWIKNNKNKYIIGIPLLAKYIRNLSSTINLRINSEGKILLNNVPINTHFSSAEEKLLQLLISKKNSIVTRDEIAEKVFRNTDDWNNWTMDKLVSRLRNKLKLLDVSPLIIKTVYGKGVMISIV